MDPLLHNIAPDLFLQHSRGQNIFPWFHWCRGGFVLRWRGWCYRLTVFIIYAVALLLVLVVRWPSCWIHNNGLVLRSSSDGGKYASHCGMDVLKLWSSKSADRVKQLKCSSVARGLYYMWARWITLALSNNACWGYHHIIIQLFLTEKYFVREARRSQGHHNFDRTDD